MAATVVISAPRRVLSLPALKEEKMGTALSRKGTTWIAGTLLSVSVFGALGMIAWPAGAQQREFFPPKFLPLGMSLNRLMVAVVDDAAHGIWAGGNKQMPLSADEWVEIEMNTFQLQAAATLVSIGGTGPADQGWVTSPAFQEKARKLSDMAVSTRSAVAAKDQMALRTVGGTLVDVCNDCHNVFKPGVPTEGIFLKRGHGY
jgi:hypothetical protein